MPNLHNNLNVIILIFVTYYVQTSQLLFVIVTTEGGTTSRTQDLLFGLEGERQAVKDLAPLEKVHAHKAFETLKTPKGGT